MSEEKIKYLPVYFAKAGDASVVTILYGLLRVLRIGPIGVVTICGIVVLGWKPSPDWA